MKVLIIKLGALGDVINSTSIIKQIMKHHTNDTVCLLTTPQFSELFSHFNNLRVFAFERKGTINKIKTIRWFSQTIELAFLAHCQAFLIVRETIPGTLTINTQAQATKVSAIHSSDSIKL